MVSLEVVGVGAFAMGRGNEEVARYGSPHVLIVLSPDPHNGSTYVLLIHPVRR